MTVRRYILDGTKGEVEQLVETRGVSNSDRRSLRDFVTTLARMDTGWLPPGVRSYTRFGDHEQIVVVREPGINKVYWGEYESDRNVKLYELAQPYQVIIGDFVNGDLLGARMFYSPTPVNHPSQPLYHQNVPNLNCRGYGGGNGVGWVCLYHRESWKGMELSEKVGRLIERCSGTEAYNNANMSETDGPRFYESHGKPGYVTDPTAWEKKSAKEGFAWTLDPDLWIPVLVKGIDDQGNHHPGGEPLTVEMAMNGYTPVYYNDRYLPKPALALRRGDDEKLTDIDLISKVVQPAFQGSKSLGKSSGMLKAVKEAEPSWEPVAPVDVGNATANCFQCEAVIPYDTVLCVKCAPMCHGCDKKLVEGVARTVGAWGELSVCIDCSTKYCPSGKCMASGCECEAALQWQDGDGNGEVAAAPAPKEATVLAAQDEPF